MLDSAGTKWAGGCGGGAVAYAGGAVAYAGGMIAGECALVPGLLEMFRRRPGMMGGVGLVYVLEVAAMFSQRAHSFAFLVAV